MERKISWHRHFPSLQNNLEGNLAYEFKCHILSISFLKSSEAWGLELLKRQLRISISFSTMNISNAGGITRYDLWSFCELWLTNDKICDITFFLSCKYICNKEEKKRKPFVAYSISWLKIFYRWYKLMAQSLDIYSFKHNIIRF